MRAAPTERGLTTRRATPLVLHSASAVALALGTAAALSHLPFVSLTPANWDAVQFALALDRFDLHAHQPHPPGYILYVLLGKALLAVMGDPTAALTLLSVLASSAAVALVYLLARRMFSDEAVAAGSALLLAASPLTLYYGSVGLTYAPEMALSVAVAALCWRLRDAGSAAGFALLGAFMAVAGGVRQTSLVVLLPLCIWALWGKREGAHGREVARKASAFGVALAAASLVWAIPLLMVSGGPGAYLRENAALAASVSKRTSLVGAGLEGVFSNMAFIVLALGVGLCFAAVPLGLWATRVVRFSLSPEVKAFAFWWAAPPLAAYLLTHVGQYGYVMVALPPLFMLSALCVRVLAERLASGSLRPLAATLVCAIIAVSSSGYFLLAQGPTTAGTIASNDAHWRAVRDALSRFDPAETALIMSVDWKGPFRMAGYVLPQFHSYGAGEKEGVLTGWLYSAYAGRSDYSLPQPAPRVSLRISEGTHFVVALDDATGERLNASGTGIAAEATPLELEDGSHLYLLTLPPAVEHSLNIRDGRIAAGF